MSNVLSHQLNYRGFARARRHLTPMSSRLTAARAASTKIVFFLSVLCAVRSFAQSLNLLKAAYSRHALRERIISGATGMY
ncbi:MAG TPA: hypothetical protein VGB55_00590 [Tepidisphaeraceae bacterium]